MRCSSTDAIVAVKEEESVHRDAHIVGSERGARSTTLSEASGRTGPISDLVHIGSSACTFAEIELSTSWDIQNLATRQASSRSR